VRICKTIHDWPCITWARGGQSCGQPECQELGVCGQPDGGEAAGYAGKHSLTA
jgi:hypothetical protein